MSPTQSPVPYFGGKQTTAARIIDQMPAHKHYVEPYAGSLAVLLAKAPVLMETVNDLDGEVMGFWQVLREQPAELSRVCALTPHSRAEFEKALVRDPELDPLERARRVWVRLTQSRTGRLTRTGWRHYVAPNSSTSFPSYLDGYVDRMAATAERLHRVSLENRPALEVIEAYGAHDDVLLYCDPPYLGSTRSSGDNAYTHEMRDDESHRAMAAALQGCRAAVVVSGYPSPLYDDELFPDWIRVEFTAGTGQSAAGWSNRTEVVWCNRQPVANLFTDAMTDELDERAGALPWR